MSCDHKWEEYRKFRVYTGAWFDYDITVVLKCEKCGDMKKFTY